MRSKFVHNYVSILKCSILAIISFKY